MTRLVLAASALLAALIVAPDAGTTPTQERMTIFARPSVLPWAAATQLFGVARGAGPESVVRVEVKECGSDHFRTYAEAHANAGGGWSLDAATGVTATFRAAWRGSRSGSVVVRQAASVSLARKRSGAGFAVVVISKRSLWRKRVDIQRRAGGAWRTVRTVRLTDSVRSTGSVSASEAGFGMSVPKGTPLRARLPLAESRPCYVESVSRVIRS